ncbi:RING-H2 finger protein ATL74 [Selaginella moellendorffii]|uniref:RING-H2 finger protein ATL74 n=1 Tax=Selaginella moellendorffii TaxID=88036 RepID=UPI000D1CCAFC|nr:RING-H2 finger protein ATL74 [Selaginella moellendorffii]|eukprot:XP_024522965.1 RING-H2 finger protein ATL74 [Selaginella moellendorffii]
MDRELAGAHPSPAPTIAIAAAAAGSSSFAMILSALLIVATIMGAMAFCVWMCGCSPEDVIRARSGGAGDGASDRSALPAAKAGMSKQAIEKALPVMSYGAARMLASQRTMNPELGCCSICLAEFGKQDDFIRMMPSCGHCFHSECIALWLVAHSSCPLQTATMPIPTPEPSRTIQLEEVVIEVPPDDFRRDHHH